jgi:glycine amidinotransferase/scyllo-inosamine-4-phosphate amidinotransferase 1
LKIHSYNEWDTLREIVVGSATNANWPTNDPVFAEESKKTTWHETSVPGGAVPEHIINEANQDLEVLCNILTSNAVRVHRPTDMDFVELGGMYNYCPRDRLLIAGDTIVDPAMMYPCRDMETQALEFVTVGNTVKYMPRQEGMVLDAANICRLGDTWLYLESWSGNNLAYQWLCEQFPNINIEKCNFYSGVHIDSTIVPLREGLVMINGSRVMPEQLPACLQDWDVIWVHQVAPQDFYQYPYASKWIAMNTLSINPDTVIVDAAQTDLIREIESRGITVIPHTLRHSRTLGGGFHCVTLDTWRE